MATLAAPVNIQKTPTKFLQTRKRSNRRLAQPRCVQAALPNPDLVNYAQLTVMTAAKLGLAANGIIHY